MKRALEAFFAGVFFFVTLFFLHGLPGARAEEGMFLPYDLDGPPIKAMKAMKGVVRGLDLDAKGIQTLLPAVVQLAQSGTGSFVSDQGLMVTNHHVAYRCLAHLDGTIKHKGIMDKGFVAGSRADEIHCPGYDALVVQRMEDVTRQVLSAVKPKMTPQKRHAAVLVQKRRMEARCEKTKGVVCSVRALNGGVGYTLTAYRRIEDVRLVYAPPKDLGKYGGDIDNWRYPRHTADFTFLRAYIGQNGRTARFSPKNVPFRPSCHLKVSTSGVRRSSFVMVLGFPGRTSRHATFFGAAFHKNHVIPFKSRLFAEILKVLPERGLGRRRYQGLNAGLNNSIKYYQDQATQMASFGLLARKRRELSAIKARIESEKAHAADRRKLLDEIRKIYEETGKISGKAILMSYLTSRLVKSLETALDIVRWSRKKRVPDIRREPERYRNKLMFKVLRQSDMLEETTTLEGEKRILTRMFQRALLLPGSQRIETALFLERMGKKIISGSGKDRTAKDRTDKDRIGKDPIRAAIDRIYDKTRIFARNVGNEADVRKARTLRRKLFSVSPARIHRDPDPLLDLARRLDRENDRLEKGPLFRVEKVLGPILRPRLVGEVIRPRYFDANFTLRLSYGKVADYTESATNKRWRYVSRLSWLMRRGTGKYPFRVPAALARAYASKKAGRWIDPVIKDVPVNFTATLDTTGGNSGSPVTNGRGELVGLLFDGTPESILADWQYLKASQRSICMDIRFALFLADKVDRARYVLQELGL